jgi:hypothetical protein
VDLKLPETGAFSCVEEIPNTIGDIRFKIEFTTNNAHTKNESKHYLFDIAEKEATDSLLNIISNIKTCCFNPSRNEFTCNLHCLLTPEEIKSFFLSKGYKQVPINVYIISAKSQSKSRIEHRSLQMIEDYSQLPYYDQEGTLLYPALYHQYDVDEMIAAGLTAKVVITKNENFCDPILNKLLMNKFHLDTFDYAAHEHIWRNPDGSGNDILFYDFFLKNNFPIVELPIEFPEANPVDCEEPMPLPNDPNISYAISHDGLKRFCAFEKVNGSWVNVGAVEYRYRLPGLPQDQLTYNDGGAEKIYNGTKTVYINAEPIEVPDYEYKPSRTAYQMAVGNPSAYPTSTLVDAWWARFVNVGVYANIPPRTDLLPDFIKTANYFKWRKEGDNCIGCFGFDCNQPVSSAAAEHPNTTDILIPRLETAIGNWLADHDDIHGLFTAPNNVALKLTNSQERYPYYGRYGYLPTHPWALAIIGGVQGVKVKIRDFKKSSNNCFEIEYLLSIVDTYGVDASDAAGYGIFLGLQNLWVLQHYRNYDFTYCPSTCIPCFRPILDFHFTFRKRMTYCRN